jgi:predicted metal-dependent enzyme (double-stranded beta helix superfamily)
LSHLPALSLHRLREFVIAMTKIVDKRGDDEAALLADSRPLLGALVSTDDWLPVEYAAPDPAGYRQMLLHADPLERFSVVSFVWGPGHKTPIHDHGVWGLVGVLRGVEISTAYDPVDLKPGARTRMLPGDVVAVSPTIGDVHQVSNGAPETSVSIHVYGGNIGAIRRHSFDAVTGAAKTFVSGYSNSSIPNLWDRSAEARLVS